MAAEALPIGMARPDEANSEPVLVSPGTRALLPVAPPSSAVRGCLRAHIDRELEQRLFELGACTRPGYVGPGSDEILGDQIYRARMLGFRTLDIQLGTVAGIVEDGVLHPVDGETLDWWAAAIQGRGEVAFRLAAEDAALLAYGPPIPFERRFDALFAVGAGAVQGCSSDVPQKLATDDVQLASVSPLRPRSLNAVGSPSRAVRTEPGALRGAMRQVLGSVERPGRSAADESYEEPAQEDGSGLISAVNERAESGPHPVFAELQHGAPDSATAGSAIQDRVATWLDGLERATGHQSYADLEQLFCQNYLPLRQALLDGHASSSSARATAQFSANFAQSYARAFEALRARGKRPTMVFDVPNLAFRLARQHAAPKHHMVLVDAMRFDIGARLEERLQLQLLGHASCVARGLLWAALPANSTTQLELLARGPEGLRQLSGALAETQIQSSSAETRILRPMRVGPHHLWKLDIVQHQVTHNAGPFTSTRLLQCSADVAVSVGRFIKDQAQGTLVFVFGDHGFNADGSPEPSPEQVLVPYQAWLVRDTTRVAPPSPTP
jgi:hypothetical protein